MNFYENNESRWMHLIGNSVAVPVVKMLTKAVVATGVFDETDWDGKTPSKEERNIGVLQIKKDIQLELNFEQYGCNS